MAGTSYDECFERLLLQHQAMLEEECARKRRQLPMDELMQHARIGLLSADAGYRAEIHGAFAPYARREVRRALDIAVDKYGAEFGIYSLNKTVGWEGNTAVEWMHLLPDEAPEPDSYLLYTKMAQALAPEERPIAWDLWEGATPEQICAAHGFSEQSLAALQHKMRTIWRRQNSG